MADWNLEKWKTDSAAHAAELEKAGFEAPGKRTLKPKDSDEPPVHFYAGLGTMTMIGLGIGVLFLGGVVAYQLSRSK